MTMLGKKGAPATCGISSLDKDATVSIDVGECSLQGSREEGRDAAGSECWKNSAGGGTVDVEKVRDKSVGRALHLLYPGPRPFCVHCGG